MLERVLVDHGVDRSSTKSWERANTYPSCREAIMLSPVSESSLGLQDLVPGVALGELRRRRMVQVRQRAPRRSIIVLCTEQPLSRSLR
jgi:hypothetical protein